jgi:hypothetical protein
MNVTFLMMELLPLISSSQLQFFTHAGSSDEVVSIEVVDLTDDKSDARERLLVDVEAYVWDVMIMSDVKAEPGSRECQLGPGAVTVKEEAELLGNVDGRRATRSGVHDERAPKVGAHPR